MSGESFAPQVLTEFDGLQTVQGSGAKVPLGRSTACENVEFSPGRVYTRSGLTQLATFASGTLASIQEFAPLDGARRLLAFTGGGTLAVENGSYSFSTISSGIMDAASAAKSVMRGGTMFGRAFMGFGTPFLGFSTGGPIGSSVPLQYDGTNLDRVAPCGPGSAPVVAQGAASALAGGMAAGNRQVRVFFKTRNGYWTAPGPAFTIDLNGKKADVSQIPTGPSWVTARVIAFTPACSSTFYFIEGSSMVINDNTTTSVTGIDFQDPVLIAGTQISSATESDEDLLNQLEIPACAGMVAYANRTIWWGQRNRLPLIGDVGFRNLSFNGGFIGNVPCGWTEKVAGGSKTSGSGAVGDALRITGNGATQTGCYENSGNAAAALPVGVKLNARVRAKKSAGAVAGTVSVYLCPTATANGSMPYAGVSFDVSQLSSTEYRIIDTALISAADNKPDSTWRLRVSGGGAFGSAITNGEYIDIDDIEVYPDLQPRNPSELLISKPNDPEAVDALLGRASVSEEDGHAIVDCFALRDNLYILKERALYVTRDNGQDPAYWPIAPVSTIVGSPSENGAALGDGWAVIAARGGLYYFDGGEPQKLSVEIQSTWDRINWYYGYTIYTMVDPERRRIVVGVPLDGATSPSHQIVMEYVDRPTGEHDFGIWTIPAICGGFSERPDGTRDMLIGTADATGKLGKYDDTKRGNDFGSPFTSFYRTAYFGVPERGLFGYCKAAVHGSGICAVSVWQPDEASFTALESKLMRNPAKDDIEWLMNTRAERAAFQVGTAGNLNEWFSLERLTAWFKPNPTAPVRGIN